MISTSSLWQSAICMHATGLRLHVVYMPSCRWEVLLSLFAIINARRDLDIRKFLDGIYVSERGLVVKAE